MMVLTIAFVVLAAMGVRASHKGEREMDMERYNSNEYRMMLYRA